MWDTVVIKNVRIVELAEDKILFNLPGTTAPGERRDHWVPRSKIWEWFGREEANATGSLELRESYAIKEGLVDE